MFDIETKQITCTFTDHDDECGLGAGVSMMVTLTADIDGDTLSIEEVSFIRIFREDGSPIYSRAVGGAGDIHANTWAALDEFVRSSVDDQWHMISALFSIADPIEIRYHDKGDEYYDYE